MDLKKNPVFPLGGVNELYGIFGLSMPSQLFGDPSIIDPSGSHRSLRDRTQLVWPVVVVQNGDWGKSHLHFFVRNGVFPNSHARQLPNRLRKTVLQHIAQSEWRH